MTALDQAAGPDRTIRRIRAEAGVMEVDANTETGHASRHVHEADLADAAGDAETAAAHRADSGLHEVRAEQLHTDRLRVLHALGDTAQDAAIPRPRSTTDALHRSELLDAVTPPVVALRNMWAQIEPTMTCWLWTGQQDDEGYGRIDDRGAHVVVYERLVGVVPDGYELDHLCNVRPCVNPGHLEAVTHDLNMARLSERWVHVEKCQRGHLLTDDAIYLSRGRRCCRLCRALRQRERRAGLR